MYLQKLNEEEKKAFLELANNVMAVDGKIMEQELDYIKAYRMEMQLSEYDYKLKIMSMQEAEEILKKSLINTKKEIYIELMGLVFCDGEYALEEKKFMEDIRKEWKISEEFVQKAICLIKQLNQVYIDLAKIIAED